MSSTQPPNPPPSDNNNEKKPEPTTSSGAAAQDGDVSMDTTPDLPVEETWDDIPEEIMSLSSDEILTRTRLIDNDLKVSRMLLQTATFDLIFIIPSGHAFRNSAVTARAECYEREDSRQRRENQTEQSTPVSCRKRCRGGCSVHVT